MTKPKGSLLAEIRAHHVHNGAKCTVPAVLARLDDADRDDITEALAAGMPATAISRALEARGVRLAAGSLRRHERGDCLCGRTS